MAKSARRSGRKTPASTPGSSGASTPSSVSGPIPPFIKVPPALQSFVEPLSPKEVYLVHLDITAEDLKRQTFTVPLIVNLVVGAVIALRVYQGISTYPALIATLIGLQSSMTVDTATTPWTEGLQIVLRRTGTLLIDYFLVTMFLSWPINFIKGPVRWRRAVGFREREVIVRRSHRSWSQKLERNKWIREDEARRDKIIAAVTPERIGKTGYLLVDEDWNLDYNAMIRAHALVDRTRQGDGVQMDEFRTAVLVHTDPDGWLIWRVGDENTPAGRQRSEQRDQILAFKDKLTEMGKEDLFLRWVELIQWESSQPGGFTPERQRSAMFQAKQLFEDENVDFSSFWDDMGGMEGMGELD
ncbi:hypothetical protein N7499_009883 [Penicillium canescens]|uniref:Uncharacterized protein n=1 Tax=Penicillium canescens TaxID=5083 RepID=A0AAD6IMR5_PENCN|nr:uncharacterized protein N7446_008102 [Penicillium canescens]KAJ6033607.1 hypothetical protein N7444_011378 [Penicillium canescens]KAJ6057203.1 hypothetical protein N7460_000477 [Penicillium canescens]KAJ6058519.1 hypothetical protein N7446_008102 [Penicillium canescens]KAJ6071869.1 hypothetical protein N7499_009883 [Penicillium canescens]KAJ6170546.1 hypothetical protein N7485_007892 [Penicillium canescens]